MRLGPLQDESYLSAPSFLMASFVSDLWESVFTPGVTPSLLKATYGAFIMLIAVLSVLLFFTRNIHVMALLIVSFCLIASLMW